MTDQSAPSVRPRAVPVVANAARVRATIVDTRADSNGRRVSHLKVNRADDVHGLPNFVKSNVGQVIEVLLPGKSAGDVGTSDEVEAQLAYRGNEHGRRFVVIGGVLGAKTQSGTTGFEGGRERERSADDHVDFCLRH
jgi:hypothetical protein